jgi:hypothetical protein
VQNISFNCESLNLEEDVCEDFYQKFLIDVVGHWNMDPWVNCKHKIQ